MSIKVIKTNFLYNHALKYVIINCKGELKIKRILSYIVFILFVLTISFNSIGCGKSNSISKSKAEDSSEPITLKLVWWGNDQRKELTQKAIDMFKQKHPNVNFETKIYGNTTDLRIALAMNTADQDMPDIIQMNYDFIHNYALRDLLEPIDPYIDENIMNISDIDKASLEGGIDNNKLYGIPLGINAYCMVVNPLIFEKAGVDIPKSGYTYDELYQTAKKLKAQIQDPDFYPLTNFVDFNTYVRAMGSTQYNLEGTALGYENDKICADFFKLQKKLKEEGLIASSSDIPKETLLASGKSAIMSAVSNNAAGVSKTAKSTMKIIAVPSGEDRKITSCVRPSMFFSVSAYSAQKKLAMEFINFITNDLEVNDVLKGERGVPIASKVSDSIENKLNDADKQQYLYMKYIKENPSKSDPNTPNAAGNVTSLFSRLSQQVADGVSTPEEAAKEFRTQANKILSGVKGE
jgi:multiple sugar transport system substrate-binding protein